MLKCVGYISIIIACTALGMERGNEIHRHKKELEELYKIFTFLKLELKMLKTPIKEALLKLKNKTDGNYKVWLEDVSKDTYLDDFENNWKNSIDIHFEESYLTTEERNELLQLGKNIGCVEAISLYLSNLELSIQNTKEEEKEKKKLYQSMGIMGGIFLVILLL